MKKEDQTAIEAEKAQRLEDSAYLKRGDVIRIAKTVKVNPQNVSAYIYGKTNSKAIKMAFDRFVEQRKKEVEARFQESINE